MQLRLRELIILKDQVAGDLEARDKIEWGCVELMLVGINYLLQKLKREFLAPL